MTKLSKYAIAIAAILVVGAVSNAIAAGSKKVAPAAKPTGLQLKPTRYEPPATTGTPAERYCVNIKDSAADARFRWQVSTIKKMETKLQEKVAALEAKIAEHKAWLDKRNEFIQKANKSLIDIYAKMRPDAAAIQLSILDNQTAASILTRLKPRSASSILNEMKPAKAAQLSSAIAGAAKPGKS